MISRKSPIFKILTCFLLLVSTAAFAASGDVYKLTLKEGSKVWIEGNSTLHAYESKTTVINLDTKSQYKTDKKTEVSLRELLIKKDAGFRLDRFFLSLPVKEFQSGIFGFDGNFNETLKFRDNPEITFSISNYNLVNIPMTTKKYIINATGALKIAGKENRVEISAIADNTSNVIVITGEKNILMTDYGMTPPNLFGGMIVTDDKVIVKWELFATLEKIESEKPVTNQK